MASLKETEEITTLRQYLLGRLPSPQQDEVEQRLFTDTNYLEELLIIEEELTDDYLASRLSASELDSFERHFLSTPERLAKLRFARNFRTMVGANASANSVDAALDRPGWLESLVQSLDLRSKIPALAFSAVVLLALIGGWFLLRSRPAPYPEQLIAEQAPPDPHSPGVSPSPPPEVNQNSQNSELPPQEQRRKDEHPRHGESNRNETTLPVTRSFTAPILAMGTVRSTGGGLQEFKVPPDVATVGLPLKLTGLEYETYRVQLQNDKLETIQLKTNLKPQASENSRVVVFTISAKKLQPGEYRVRLIGLRADSSIPPDPSAPQELPKLMPKEIGVYDFRVLAQ